MSLCGEPSRNRVRSPDGDMTMFATLLEHDRKRADLSLAHAARRFGLSPNEYHELEAGTRFPTFEIYDAICRRFGWPRTFYGVSSLAASPLRRNAAPRRVCSVNGWSTDDGGLRASHLHHEPVPPQGTERDPQAHRFCCSSP